MWKVTQYYYESTYKKFAMNFMMHCSEPTRHHKLVLGDRISSAHLNRDNVRRPRPYYKEVIEVDCMPRY